MAIYASDPINPINRYNLLLLFIHSFFSVMVNILNYWATMPAILAIMIDVIPVCKKFYFPDKILPELCFQVE